MHVVANRSASPPALIPGSIVVTFPTHKCAATVVDGRWDARSDWALLRCTPPPPPGLRPVPLAEGAGDGAEWETFGFPEANSRDGLAQLGTLDHAAATFDGVAAYQLFSKQAAAGVGAPVKGLSGGPVIVDGALVGVFRSSLMRDGQFNVAGTLYACPIDTILDRCADLLPVPDPCRGLPGLPRIPLPPSPYRFLERFTARDAEIFFGRNREIRELFDRVVSDGGASVVLLYGQSGAGKSSFLDAGLLPRLTASHATLYARRDRAKGLLCTLVDAMVQAFPGCLLGSSPPDQALLAAWAWIESATARPLVVILDQAEEVFTMPSADATELSAFVEALTAMLRSEPRPRGRLVLAFRKEWLGEIQKPLDQHGVDYSKVFLEALGADAVTEVVSGLTLTKRLREKYGSIVEDDVAAAIAGDLTIDRDSPVAPTLQVLLSRMWVDATAASSGAPRFTLDLYQRVTRGGFLLTDFLDHQLAALAVSAKAAGGSVADVVESGLALDVLRFHVSRLGTAEERTHQALVDEYHRDADVAWLVGELKRLYLLTEPAGDGVHTAATRLAHDTLAQAIRTRCDESLLPGQRARRVLEGRASEWSDGREGTPLDARDLMRVEQGVTGMRAFRPDEERLIAASRLVRDRDSARKRRARYATVAAALLVLVAGGAALLLYLKTLADKEWSDLIGFTDAIPTVLDMDPALGLAVAIDGVDRSLGLNDGVVSAALQEHLADALDVARERNVWTLPALGTATAISSDRRIAVGTKSGSIHLYALDASEPSKVIQASTDAVNDLSFSEDGEFLAGALGKDGVVVWTRSGDRVPALPAAMNGRVAAVRFVPGGHRMVALIEQGGQYVACLYDVASRQVDLAPLGRPPGWDGRALPAAPLGGWDVQQPLAVALDGADRLLVATLIPGDLILMLAADGMQWERRDTLPVIVQHRVPNAVAVQGVALARDARRQVWLAAASRERITVSGWGHAGNWTVARESNVSFGKVSFGSGARTVIAGDSDGVLHVYDSNAEQALTPYPVANTVSALAVSADGEFAVVAGDNAETRVSVIDMVGLSVAVPALSTPAYRNDQTLDPWRNPPRLSAMAFRPSGQLVAVDGGATSGIWQVDLPRGRATPAVRQIARLRSGGLVVADRTGRVFGADGDGISLFSEDGSPATPLPSIGQEVALVISPDGRTLVSGNSKGLVGILDIANKKLVTVSGPSALLTLAFEPAGQRFGAAYGSADLRFYGLDGTDVGGAVAPAGTEFAALIFHPLEGYTITGSNRGEVRTSRVINGIRQEWAIRVFSGGAINGFAVHPSGSQLYVAGAQGLRVIDLETGSLLNAPLPFSDVPLRAVTVSPDGRLVVGAKASGGFLFWRADWHEWLAEGCERLRHHELFTTIAKTGKPIDTIPGLEGIEPSYALNACQRLVWNKQ